MEMKFRNLVILILTIFFIVNCTSTPEPDTLLTLGNKNYSLTDFFETNKKESFIKIPESSKIDRIEKWADAKLFEYVVKNKNIKADEKINKQLETLKEQSTIRYYLDKTILDSIITEKLMKDTYNNLGREVNASHILIQYRDVNPKVDRTKTEAIALAEEVLEKAKKGENFAELANKYSDDQGSKKDGNLGYFGLGKMVEPFEKAVFALDINEVSDVVESKFGYHIIKLNSMRKNSVQTFEKEKDNIKNMLVSSKGDQLRATYRKRVEDLKKLYGYKINQSTVDTILTQVTKAQRKDGKNQKPEIIYLKNLKLKESLGECNGKEITLKDLIKNVENSSRRLPPQFVNSKYFIPVIDNFYVSDLFLLDFEKRNIQYDDDFKKNIENQKIKMLIKELKKDLFRKDIDITEKEIKDYYEEKKSTKFMTSKKSEVREIYTEDKEQGEKLLQEVLKNQEKFEEFSEKLTERYRKKDKPGYLGKITERQYGTLGRAADTTEANTINPDLIKVGRGWSIIKVYEKINPEPKELKLVESTIRRTLKDKKIKDNQTKVMNDLKKKYKFKIYWNCVNIEK